MKTEVGEGAVQSGERMWLRKYLEVEKVTQSCAYQQIAVYRWVVA